MLKDDETNKTFLSFSGLFSKTSWISWHQKSKLTT